MKLKKYRNDVYPFTLFVSCDQSTQDLANEFDKNSVAVEEMGWEEGNLAYCYSPVSVNKECGILMRFRQKKTTTSDVVAHEAFHVVRSVFERLNIPINADTDECAAYLIQWVVNCVNNYFKNKE